MLPRGAPIETMLGMESAKNRRSGIGSADGGKTVKHESA
jgi:hypothetical protein